MAYFGLSIASVSLSGGVYANFALSMLIEIPAYIASWLVLDWLVYNR